MGAGKAAQSRELASSLCTMYNSLRIIVDDDGLRYGRVFIPWQPCRWKCSGQAGNLATMSTEVLWTAEQGFVASLLPTYCTYYLLRAIGRNAKA
ncbi:predicted protein [Plenodomus lingam JN3]|uniref:Predicted protein n=1 Tax=Leptosphaeria maculans (strain JN3 / isolate v23.1.3 / race Av1-4-5-6-7-8) TaxID=985895 RepID=E5AAI2_LEPMJ|nr:predicted protein [Plenodomus lingam JN3]CBY00673.1 predicted protein [Plenodomus lingam JN3]